MKHSTQSILFKKKPSINEVEFAKNCPHPRTTEVIDETFTGIAEMCTTCKLILRWIIKPDKSKSKTWLD